MRPLSVLVLLALSVPAVSAQEGPPPLTQADGWRSAWTAQLAASQAAYSNWQEGGVSSLAFTSTTGGTFERVVGAFKQKHEARFAYGLLKQDSLDFRKAEDLMRYGLTVQYRGWGVLQPTLSLAARSQFAPGYDYSPSGADYPTLPVMDGERLKVSDFGAPAYLTQSLGITYDPDRWYSARLGLGVKETVVGIERLRPLYGNAADEAIRVEAGLDAEINVVKELVRNVRLESRLGVFAAFNQLGDNAPDTIFENALIMTVNDVLNVNLNVVTLFDRDVSEDIQIKEILALGVSFKLLGNS